MAQGPRISVRGSDRNHRQLNRASRCPGPPIADRIGAFDGPISNHGCPPARDRFELDAAHFPPQHGQQSTLSRRPAPVHRNAESNQLAISLENHGGRAAGEGLDARPRLERRGRRNCEVPGGSELDLLHGFDHPRSLPWIGRSRHAVDSSLSRSRSQTSEAGDLGDPGSSNRPFPASNLSRKFRLIRRRLSFQCAGSDAVDAHSREYLRSSSRDTRAFYWAENIEKFG